MALLGPNGKYEIAGDIGRSGGMLPYKTPRNLPHRIRPLRIFSLDPSISRLEGAIAIASVPYEELRPGPSGRLFSVDLSSIAANTRYEVADLDDHQVLMESGYDPDPADSRFHAQMVYAVAMITYEAFRKALGRHTAWAISQPTGAPGPLKLLPVGIVARNAFYSREEGFINFGHFNNSGDDWKRGYPPDVHVFTSQSADVITHEVTHAILDGLRSNFLEPVSHDVFAFHEAFADLIAVFQRFTFKEMVRAQIARSRGDLTQNSLLGMLAPEFARASGLGDALRTFLPIMAEAAADETNSSSDRITTLGENLTEPHDRGRVLTEAIFEAFVTIVQRKSRRYIRLATGGAARLPEGASLTADLLDELVHVTCRTADQFRTICIRAIDYCPPVDINFGDYLRALVTADSSLVARDPWGYREAIINSFRRRKIFPRMLPNLSESSLMWSGPELKLAPIERLALTNLDFDGDPGIPATKEEIERQAMELGEALTSSPHFMSEAGLIDGGLPAQDGSWYSLPRITSIRPARRTGPDGELDFDLIAEFVQARHVPMGNGKTYAFVGGATIIIDAWGKVEYIVRKRVNNEERLEECREFVRKNMANFFQTTAASQIVPKGNLFRDIHKV